MPRGRSTRITSRRRWAVAIAATGAAVLVAAGCGSSDEPSAPTTTAVAASSSTGGTDAPGTTKPTTSGTTPGTPPGTSRTRGTTPGGTIVGVPNETIEADEVAEDVTWVLNAEAFRGKDGLLVAYDCAPDGAAATIWGDGTYTDDSSVCTAAVHAGLIDLTSGGRVVIEIGPGLESYEASTANGITSIDYGSWPGSFTFPGI